MNEQAPWRFVWTASEVYRCFESAHLSNGSLNVIDGELLMKPPAPPRVTCCISLVADSLRNALNRVTRDCHVRERGWMGIDENTVVSPDVHVWEGTIRQPGNALLVAEVSVTTLKFDLGGKSHLYAAAGILEYWVIDVNASQVHVHRDTIADAESPHGFRYASVQVLNPADRIAPLAAPESSILVGDLLP